MKISQSIKNILAVRQIILEMALKQVKSKYAGSFMGVWLAVINPLLIMGVISFVFIVVFDSGIKNFPLFALAGIMPWMFFANSLSDAVFSLVNQKSVMHQFNFAREALPLAAVLSNFLNFLIGWLIIYPLFVFYNVKVVMFLPLLAGMVVLYFLFVCGLSLLFSMANVFIRDIGQLLNILMMLWFWLTPVFYSQEMVPQRFHWLLNLNPLTPYIICYRDVVFIGRFPDFLVLAAAFFWAVISLAAGIIVFSQQTGKLLKRI